MSIEDGMIIAALLGKATSPAEAAVALKVYDQIRRPRTQKIVDSSWKTGQMMMGIDKDAGTDAVKLRAALRDRWDFIMDLDLEQHREEAIQLMEAKLKQKA